MVFVGLFHYHIHVYENVSLITQFLLLYTYLQFQFAITLIFGWLEVGTIWRAKWRFACRGCGWKCVTNTGIPELQLLSADSLVSRQRVRALLSLVYIAFSTVWLTWYIRKSNPCSKNNWCSLMNQPLAVRKLDIIVLQLLVQSQPDRFHSSILHWIVQCKHSSARQLDILIFTYYRHSADVVLNTSIVTLFLLYNF